MKINILLVLLFSCVIVRAQNVVNYTLTDSVALAAPDSVTGKIELLATYFNTHFSLKKDKLRAIYSWETHHIAYDVANRYNYNFNAKPAVLAYNAFQNRRAVCQGYAELFKALAIKCDIPAYVVGGYTRQNDEVINMPHAWVAVQVNDSWYLTDPTWGAGYIASGKFRPHFNNNYFLMTPTESIHTHMPFDPMWQLLEHPVTNNDFYNKNFTGNNGTIFNYADSIHFYKQKPKLLQLQASERRIEANGTKNPMIYNKLQNLKQNIFALQQNMRVSKQNQAANLYNQAAYHYNNAIELFNQYIAYFNHQFKPSRPDEEIQQMLDTCKTEVRTSLQLLKSTNTGNNSISSNISQLNNMLHDVQEQVKQQQDFLDKYFKTGKIFRPVLFRKYKFMGIPLN